MADEYKGSLYGDRLTTVLQVILKQISVFEHCWKHLTESYEIYI